MLSNYPEVARNVGLDPDSMLSRAGLHPGALRDSENWIPGDCVLDLLEESAVRSKRDDFGVLLGERRTFASLGPVSLLLRHEPTLGDIMRSAIEYRRLINEFLQMEIRSDGSTAVLEWNLVPGLRSSQGINLLATIAYRVLTYGAGVDWHPDCLHFRHSMPNEIGTFRRVFPCALEFDADLDGMSLASDCLQLPNRQADAGMIVHAKRLLSLLPGIRGDETVTERATAAIPFLLANGRARAEDLAWCLGMPLRSLQRKLIAEGTSYRELLRDARRELAVRYLLNSGQSITRVAHSTGFRALSSFTRWFISEFRLPPARWRSMMRRRDALHISTATDSGREHAGVAATPIAV